MKTLICSVLLFTYQILPQSYLNIHFGDGSYKNSLIGSLEKITLSASYDQLNFHLAGGTIRTENISEMKKLTLDNFPLGEPLPVELSMFTAVINGSTIVLKWQTETEVTNYGFEIERSVGQIIG